MKKLKKAIELLVTVFTLLSIMLTTVHAGESVNIYTDYERIYREVLETKILTFDDAYCTVSLDDLYQGTELERPELRINSGLHYFTGAYIADYNNDGVPDMTCNFSSNGGTDCIIYEYDVAAKLVYPSKSYLRQFMMMGQGDFYTTSLHYREDIGYFFVESSGSLRYETTENKAFKITPNGVELILESTENKNKTQYDKLMTSSIAIDGEVESNLVNYYIPPVSVIVNGEKISSDVQPVIINGRTLVPLRAIFEAMNATVEWNDATSTATAVRDNITIEVPVGGDSVIYKNGLAIKVDVPAQLISNRTMVPVRVIAETFGADVQWDENTRTVTITE